MAVTKSGDSGSADKQADQAIAGGAGLSGLNGSKNVSGGDVLEKSSNRQQAETSEGGVSVAASFVLNIQDNAANAAIDGDAALVAVRAEPTARTWRTAKKSTSRI